MYYELSIVYLPKTAAAKDDLIPPYREGGRGERVRGEREGGVQGREGEEGGRVRREGGRRGKGGREREGVLFSRLVVLHMLTRALL